MKEIEDTIKKNTQDMIKKILSRAERVSEKELSLAMEKREKIILHGREKEDKTISMRKNSLKAQLILEYRLKEDNFKDKLCSELLNEAKQSITEGMDDNIMMEALKGLIAEGVLNLGLDRACIAANKKTSALLRKHYKQILNFVKEKTDNFKSMSIDGSLNAHGLIIRSETSGEFFDNTFERRFKRFEEEFKKEILGRLE